MINIIYIDNRGSGEGELYTLLSNKHLAVERRYIESGDIVFDNIGIERKTISDLINSVIGNNRHFWEQLKVLKDTYEKPLLLIEGSIDYKNKLVTGILFAVLLRWNIPYINTYNIYDTAEAVSRMFIKCGQNKVKGYPPAAVKKETTIEKIQWTMLQCIRNVGPSTATKILETVKFNELHNVQDAKWLANKINGLGVKTASKLVEVFNDVNDRERGR